MTDAVSEGAAVSRAWPMLRTMVGVGVLCGLLIVSVFQWTRPRIARNEALALERAIFQVLPDADASRSFRPVGDGGFETAAARLAGETLVHAGYDPAGRLIGLALEAAGMGYQDVVRVLYGYSFELDAIIGLRVLESRETPGLGDRIETDPAFLRNFERLAIPLSDDLSRVVHPIEATKPGTKQHPWQVDGITGATISATAIADILRRSTMHWIPAVRRHLDDFRSPE